MDIKFSNEEAVGITLIDEDLIWELWDYEDAGILGEEFVSEVRVFEDKIEADILIPTWVHYDDLSFRKLRKEKKIFAWDDLLLMNKTLAKIFKKD